MESDALCVSHNSFLYGEKPDRFPNSLGNGPPVSRYTGKFVVLRLLSEFLWGFSQNINQYRRAGTGDAAADNTWNGWDETTPGWGKLYV